MPVFKLADEHPLTKAGLRCVQFVEKAELGLRLGDIVFEFPFGRIVDTGMACRRDGMIPPEIDIMTIHKEANATQAASNEQAQEEKRPRERAAVRFAQAITIDAGNIPADVYADVIREFTPKERIEVAIVATSMGMLNKLNDALRVPLESEFEGLVE